MECSLNKEADVVNLECWKKCLVVRCTNASATEVAGNGAGYCVAHMHEKVCMVEGCTEIILSHEHKNLRYCVKHRRETQCAYKGCRLLKLSVCRDVEVETRMCEMHMKDEVSNFVRRSGRGWFVCGTHAL